MKTKKDTGAIAAKAARYTEPFTKDEAAKLYGMNRKQRREMLAQWRREQRRLRKLAALLVLFSAGCSSGDLEPLPDDLCGPACVKYRSCGRPEGEPLPDGTTCEKICVETQKLGADVLRLECVTDPEHGCDVLADACDLDL